MSTSDEPVRSDVIVVGAGLAGLTTARLLAARGHRVVAVDPAPPGGRGRSDEVAGALLNRGPHALYRGGHAERVLRSLDVPLSGGSPSTSMYGLRDGRMGMLPGGAASLARTTLLGARGKLAVARLLPRLPRIRVDRLHDVAFAAWLDGEDLPADARALVEMLARVSSYSHAPDIASAGMVVAQMQMALRSGVTYLDGGWQRLVDHLADGVSVRRGTVTSVAGDGAGVEVRCADGPPLVARAAVVALANPSSAAVVLGRAPFAVGPAVEAACLDLVTSRPSDPGLLLGVDEPLYLSNHCPPADLAPAGRSVVHVARYLAPGEQRDPSTTRAELAAHAARAGLGADAVVEARYLHRMTVVGALATAALGGLLGRPAVTDTGIANVFLAGDWVGPHGHLLDASLASADDAASRIHTRLSAATLVAR